MAWAELGTTRTYNLGPGPIPWDNIVQYGQFHGLDGDNLLDFVQIIFAIDAKWLELKNAEAEQRRQNKKPPDG